MHREGIAYLRWLWMFLLRKDVQLDGFWLRLLRKQNLKSALPVIASGGPVVSLTTFGDRLESVYLTLESIAAGKVLPSRLILWLDDKLSLSDLQEPLRRLQRRGLEIKFRPSAYGPHGKYFGYIESEQLIVTPLVTADDDVLYCSWWLEGLVEAYESDSSVIHCYRAHVFCFENGGPAPYHLWRRCRSTVASFSSLATGVSGCIYPPQLLMQLKSLGTKFIELCPRQDDIWLHVNELRSGYKVKQIADLSYDFPIVPGTQEASLSKMNVGLNQNDLAIRRNYTESELEMIRRS